jgi:hypothetical protein
MIDRRKRSSVLHIQLFRAADCDTDRYLVVTKVMVRLGVSKQGLRRFHIKRFSLEKLNQTEGKEQYGV